MFDGFRFVRRLSAFSMFLLKRLFSSFRRSDSLLDWKWTDDLLLTEGRIFVMVQLVVPVRRASLLFCLARSCVLVPTFSCFLCKVFFKFVDFYILWYGIVRLGLKCVCLQIGFRDFLDFQLALCPLLFSSALVNFSYTSTYSTASLSNYLLIGHC